MFIKLLALKLFKNLLKIFCKEDEGSLMKSNIDNANTR